MFDFGFSELVVCGIVGLVVLGPEGSPVVLQDGRSVNRKTAVRPADEGRYQPRVELAELKKIRTCPAYRGSE